MTNELLSECAQAENALAQVDDTLSGRAHTLDLAMVRSALAAALAGLANGADATSELAALREDLAARVRGMQSAIAAATDSSDGSNADTLEELVALNAAELIKRYRITCARFRDTFPGRLAYLNSRGASKKKHDWTDYQT
ncbi:MAG: hypothetical protein IH914_01740 [candidate division Zixibacteria bacterium]|nr:hypothetical protein [candidate division Zixibacteria bacterium]